MKSIKKTDDDDDHILIDPNKLVNHALRNDCNIVPTDRDNIIWLERKGNRDLKYYVYPFRKMYLRQAQFACLQSLKIPLMSRADWT